MNKKSFINTVATENNTNGGTSMKDTNNTNTNILGGMTMMNNDNRNFGGDKMENVTMDSFAAMVKDAVSAALGEGYDVSVREALKNNGMRLTGLCISTSNSNISPSIYLDGFLSRYQDGDIDISGVCRNVLEVYRNSRLDTDLDVSMVTDFASVKDRLCYKLVSAPHNKALLEDAPHRVVFGDLAVVYTVILQQDAEGTASVTVRNGLSDMWDVTEDEMYAIALNNTQRLFRGSVNSLQTVLMEFMSKSDVYDNHKEFYDMAVSDSDMIPMYVCSNTLKVNGAGVILYEGLLKDFSEKIGSNFYIIPSSIHETLLVPASVMLDPKDLMVMVHEVNRTTVSENEFLSDSVYMYCKADDSITKA